MSKKHVVTVDEKEKAEVERKFRDLMDELM